MIGHYSQGQDQEYCLDIDHGRATKICLIAPLFDEANKLRRTLAQVMRLLDQNGIDSILPDLPGTNESLKELSNITPSDWKDALSAATSQSGKRWLTASVRAGAMLDDFARQRPCWRLAPIAASKQMRTMMRAETASRKEDGEQITRKELEQMLRQGDAQIAGFSIRPPLGAWLLDAPLPDQDNIRTVKLGEGTDDQIIGGSPLWLRAEPDFDPVLAQAMASDLSQWSKQCASN